MSPFAIARSWSCNARRAALLALALVLLTSVNARAHQGSLTHTTAELSVDRKELTFRTKFSPPDLSEALGLGVDVDPPDHAVAAGQERLLDHVLAHVIVTNDGDACPVERLGAHVLRQGSRFIEVAFRVRCPQPFSTLVIEYDLFFDIDPMHRGLLQVLHGEDRAVAELKSGHARFIWDLGQPPPSGTLGFLVSGIEHIVFGFDHIAFLLCLLLVVVVARDPVHGWKRRELGAALRSTAAIVTSFTLAHSITLIAASLGWIHLDSRLVESVIAASIVYVAVEDLLRPDARHRYAITFGFGLVHGLGFASMLEVLLPPEHVIVPLLVFNLGVELGQLAIVAVVLPLLHLAAWVMNAPRYRALFIPLGAGVLGVFGLLWLIERAFDVTLLGL